ncbi:MAG: hypothetical protein KAX38_00900, partial [Candidatus Krumholzibacteria bacterium]|nr:hypothetical protein [Candidatus Krumholzibacteria bacterium]
MKKIRHSVCFVISFVPVLFNFSNIHPAEYNISASGIIEDRAAADSTKESPAVAPAEGRPIDYISIVGCHRVSRVLVLRALDLKEGEPFSNAKAIKGLKKVEKLGGVVSAEMRALPVSGKENIRLFIIISEEETRFIRPQLSRRLTNDWSVGLRLVETNFRENDEKLHASLLVGGATIVEGGWLKSFFLENPLFGIGLHFAYMDYEYLFPDFKDRLVSDRIRRLQTALSLRFNALDCLTLTASPGMDRIDVEDSMLIDQGTGEVPDSPSGTFPTFEIGLEIDMLDNEFYPTSGFKISACRKDWGFFRENAEMKNFLYRMKGTFCFRIGRPIFSIYTRDVFVHGRAPLLLVQHLGGEGSIRGYDYGIFSGANSVLGSATIRFPLNFHDI